MSEGPGAILRGLLLVLNKMFSREYFGIVGDQAWRERERARKRREYTLQAVLVFLLILVLSAATMNVADNLAARHIHSGFAFLSGPAGFDIGEALIPFTSTDHMGRAFVVGILNTIKVSVWAILASTVLGVVVGLMRLSRHPMLKFLGAAHVEVYRNIPLLVLLLAVYLVVTELLPAGRSALHIGNWIYLSKAGLQYASPVWGWAATTGSVVAAAVAAFVTGKIARRYMTGLLANCTALVVFCVSFVALWIICGAVGGWEHPVQTRFALRGGSQLSPEFLALFLGLTLFTSAAIAEIVRAGVLAVRPEQWNAGLALGLTMSETVSYVIFPQSMRLAIPPLASQYMNLTKNSSLAVMVGYPDLVNIGNTAINVSAQALEVICIIMSVYLVLNLIISVIMNRINARIMRAPQ